MSEKRPTSTNDAIVLSVICVCIVAIVYIIWG